MKHVEETRNRGSEPVSEKFVVSPHRLVVRLGPFDGKQKTISSRQLAVHLEPLDSQRNTILLHLGLGETFDLNKTAMLVWEQVNGKRTIGQIVNRIAKQFETDAAVVRKDILLLLSQLEQSDFIHFSKHAKVTTPQGKSKIRLKLKSGKTQKCK